MNSPQTRSRLFQKQADYTIYTINSFPGAPISQIAVSCSGTASGLFRITGNGCRKVAILWVGETGACFPKV